MKYHSDPYDPLQMITALYIDCFVMLCKQVAYSITLHRLSGILFYMTLPQTQCDSGVMRLLMTGSGH